MTEKQKKELKLIRRLSRSLDYIVLIFSLLALFIGIYAYWDTYQVMKLASNEEYAVYKPDKKDDLSLQELKNINPDTCGWVEIYGTKIDYPIVQGEDNWEYLNKTVLGEFSAAGSVFLDYRNNKDFTDFQNILYGHHMDNQKMFGDLDRFNDKDFFEKNRYGLIHRFGQSSLGIEIFAYLKTVGTDQELLSPAKSIEEKKDLIDYIYDKALYSRKIDFADSKNLVVLDTCEFSQTNGRSILVGKLSDKVVENKLKVKKDDKSFSNYFENAYKLDLLKLFLIIWILLVLIYLIYEMIIRKRKERMDGTNA